MAFELKLQDAMNILRQVALKAGHEIMVVYNQPESQVWNKEDSSPLTEADLRADRVIRQELESHFPGVFIWSEESVSRGKAEGKLFFLVDPLDGTKEFIRRNGEFTVNIALIEAGKTIVSCVYAPALNEMFYAARGHGTFFEKDNLPAVPLQLTEVEGKESDVLRVIGSRSHGADALDEWIKLQARPCELVAAGSSLKFCRVAQGLADVYPRFGPTSQWDTAAGQGILEMAGGQVLDLEGQELRYGMDLPVLNGHFIAASPAGGNIKSC